MTDHPPSLRDFLVSSGRGAQCLQVVGALILNFLPNLQLIPRRLLCHCRTRAEQKGEQCREDREMWPHKHARRTEQISGAFTNELVRWQEILAYSGLLG